MLKPRHSSGYFIYIAHSIPTITFDISTLIIPIFQVGKLRPSKSVMYPGLASGFEPKMLLPLTTNLIYCTCSLALGCTKTRETSVEMGEHFAQIIGNPQDNPTKKVFYIIFYRREIRDAESLSNFPEIASLWWSHVLTLIHLTPKYTVSRILGLLPVFEDFIT